MLFPLGRFSEKRFEDGCRVFTEEVRRHLLQLKAGKLAAYCYNECEDYRLQAIFDLMGYEDQRQ